MTGEELVACRKRLGIQQNQLAILLDTPVRNLQDWEAGKTRIPGHFAVLMGYLIERDEILTQQIVDRLKAKTRIDYKKIVQEAASASL